MRISCGDSGKKNKEHNGRNGCYCVKSFLLIPSSWVFFFGFGVISLISWLYYRTEKFLGFFIICLALKTLKQSWRKRMWTWINLNVNFSLEPDFLVTPVPFLPKWKYKGASSTCLHHSKKTMTPLKTWSSGEREECLWIISSVFHPGLPQTLPVLCSSQGQNLGCIPQSCLVNCQSLPRF